MVDYPDIRTPDRASWHMNTTTPMYVCEKCSDIDPQGEYQYWENIEFWLCRECTSIILYLLLEDDLSDIEIPKDYYD